MIRLGTPAEQEVASRFLAAMPPDEPKANPMAAPPRQRPPIVTYYNRYTTVNVTQVRADAARNAAEFEAAMAKVEEQLAQAAAGNAALSEALRKMAEEIRKAAYAERGQKP